MRDVVKGKEHFKMKLKDLGIDASKIDWDLKEEIEKIEQEIEKTIKKDGVAGAGQSCTSRELQTFTRSLIQS